MRYDFVKEVIGPEKPVRSITTYRATYNPNLFISQAVYYSRQAHCFGYACATGYDLEETKMKATMEAYERYACSTPSCTVVRDKAKNFVGEYVDLGEYAPLRKSQLKACKLKPFSPNKRISWVAGTDFVTDEIVLIPFDMVYYGFPTRDRLYYANSSGVAAHIDAEKAIELAVAELVERDALMRFWIEGKALEIDSQRECIKSSMEIYKTIGRTLQVFQIPSNYGEVFLATIRGKEWPAFVCGASATLTGERTNAIKKAIEEAEANFNYFNNGANSAPSPEDCTTPDQHGLFYCNPENAKHLAFNTEKVSLPRRTSSYDGLEKLYHDLDLKLVWLTKAEEPIKVVRVLSKKLVPISFGKELFHWTHPKLEDNSEEWLKLPHFFP